MISVKKFAIFFILLLVISQSSTLLAHAVIDADYIPLTVDANVNANYATGYFSDNRISFTTKGYNYVFYIDLVADLVYSSKTEAAAAWGAATIIATVDGNFPQGGVDVYYDPPSDKISLVWIDSVNFDLLLRTGTCAAGVITWDAAAQILVNGANLAAMPESVQVIRVRDWDTSGVPFVLDTWSDMVCYVQTIGGVDVLKALRSTNNFNTGVWVQESSTTIQTSAGGGQVTGSSLASYGGGTASVIYWYDNTVTAKLYAVNCAQSGIWDVAGKVTGPVVTGPTFSAVGSSFTTIGVAWFISTGPLNDIVRFTTYNGIVFGAATDLEDDAGGGIVSFPCISVDVLNNEFTITWHDNANFYQVQTTGLVPNLPAITIGTDPDNLQNGGADARFSVDEYSSTTTGTQALAGDTILSDYYSHRFYVFWESALNGGAIKEFSFPVPVFVSLDITDFDDVNNMYAMHKFYTLVIVGTETLFDIDNVYVYGTDGSALYTGTPKWEIDATTLSTAPAYAVISGAITINGAGCSWVAGTGTLTLSFEFNGDYPQAMGQGINCYIEDLNFNEAYGEQNAYCDVITRLVIPAFTCDHATETSIQPPHGPVIFSGTVYYATTTTGNTASAIFPPDAEFASVDLHLMDQTLVGTDATIINGAFSISITVGASWTSYTFHPYISLIVPWTSVDAPNNPWWVLTITAPVTFYLLNLLENAFAYFGMAGMILGQLFPQVLILAAYIPQAILNFAGMLLQIIIFINFGFGSILYWLTSFFNFFIQLFTIIGNLINGTTTVWAGVTGISTGLGNMWTTFNFTAWQGFVPVIVFVVWIDGLYLRAKRAGQSEIQIIAADLQLVSWVVGEFFNWSYTIFSFVFNMVMSFLGGLTGGGSG